MLLSSRALFSKPRQGSRQFPLPIPESVIIPNDTKLCMQTILVLQLIIIAFLKYCMVQLELRSYRCLFTVSGKLLVKAWEVSISPPPCDYFRVWMSLSMYSPC